MAAKNVIIRTAALERAYKSRTEGISMEKLTVEQALEALLEHTKVIEETETVPLLQACGRVLAKDMIAGFDNPPFDRSPVDGYACKAEDITDASESHPVQLTVLEEIDAGQYSRVTVEKGQAVRIMTGAAFRKAVTAVSVRRIQIMEKRLSESSVRPDSGRITVIRERILKMERFS